MDTEPQVPLTTPKWLRVALWSTLSFLAASPDGRAVEGDVIGRLQTMGIDADRRAELWQLAVRDGKLIEIVDGHPANTLVITSKGRDLVLQLGAYSFSQ